MTKPFTLIGTPALFCPHEQALSKVFAANQALLEYHGVTLDYFLVNPHVLSTISAIEEIAVARTVAAHDYPQDYLPLLPQQAAIFAGLALTEELGDVDHGY